MRHPLCRTALPIAFGSLVFALVAGSPPEIPDPRPPITEGETITVDEVDRAALAEWIRTQGRPPVDFLVGRFADHDVVMVGEIHGLHAHAGFVAEAIGPLYERAGVRLLCTEFVRAGECERLNAILVAETWDEAAAVDVMRDGPWPTWGWREYVDIFEAAWRVNATRPEGAPPFRIAGIDDDWTQLGMLDADRMESFQLRLRREAVLHESTRAAIAGHGPRAVVHVGAAHAVRHGIRLAERLHGDHGERLTTVILHHRLKTRTGRSPVETLIDEAVVAASGKPKPVAFAIVGSPLARVRDGDLAPMAMLGPASALEDFAPALVYFGPADTLARGTWIDGFVAARRFEEARAVALRLKMIKEDEGRTPEALDAALAEKLSGPSARTSPPARPAR